MPGSALRRPAVALLACLLGACAPLQPPPAPVTEFENHLVHAGLDDVVPISHLMRTATDWARCGGPQVELPPREQWPHMLKVLALVAELKRFGILRQFEAVSNYRNPSLNDCAGGAPRSAHTRSFAMDIVGPRGGIDEARLCAFWRERGQPLEMGLGKYPSGRIHIDAAGYRTWGTDKGCHGGLGSRNARGAQLSSEARSGPGRRKAAAANPPPA